MAAREESYSILLAHADEGSRKILHSIVEALGHRVALATDSGAKLTRHAQDQPFDLIISSVKLDDGDAIHYLVELAENDPKPTIIVTSKTDLSHVEQALQDHVMSYLVEPVTKDDLRPSIYLVMRRFAEFQALKEEVADLKSALQARKLVERAKGILMKSKDLDEETAYRKLQKLASEKRKKLAEVAEAIVLADEI